MAEFIYNNNKNTSIGYIFFDLNCGYYLYILYKKDIDFWSKSNIANKLSVKL